MFHDIVQSVMDSIDACQGLQEFTAGQTVETYRADRLRRRGIEREFEILGESLNRVDKADPSFREYLPEMGRIIGMRNRISHGYDQVDDEVILLTAKERIPVLQEKLMAWLKENG